MPRRVLIVGCGYVGLPLALQMKEHGDETTGWVRSEASAIELKEKGITRTISGSVADESCWSNVTDKFDYVVHCASSGGGGVPAYQEVFLEGVRLMNLHQAQARRLFVSSTSVYGQTDGQWVDENSLARPASETSQVLREAEEEALNGDAIVIRSAGIYGPDRALLFEKFRKGEAVIEGDGTRWINQIHQLDLVSAISHLLEEGTPGQVYNAADNEPVTLRDYYAWCAETLHQSLPPYGPVNTQRKRGLTNKRIDNRKLRGVGWLPHYPSFREGLAGASRYSPR